MGRGRHRASRSLGFLDPVAADHTPPSALKETADTITEYLGHGGGAVVEDAGSIVGAVLWNEEKGSLYVGRLSVHPEHRRRGIAAALMESAEREARRRGLPVMRLGVRLALEDNRRFFAAYGFTETTLHRHPGFTEPTWVTMERHLESGGSDAAPPPTPPHR